MRGRGKEGGREEGDGGDVDEVADGAAGDDDNDMVDVDADVDADADADADAVELSNNNGWAQLSVSFVLFNGARGVERGAETDAEREAEERREEEPMSHEGGLGGLGLRTAPTFEEDS